MITKKNMNERKKLINTILILAVVGVLFVVATVIGTGVKTEDNQLTIKALFFSETIEYSDIASIELRTDIDYGTRVVGSDFIGAKSGAFSNKEFGKYRCAIVSSQKDAIVVKKTDGSYVVFNTKNNDELNNILNTVKSKMP